MTMGFINTREQPHYAVESKIKYDNYNKIVPTFTFLYGNSRWLIIDKKSKAIHVEYT